MGKIARLEESIKACNEGLEKDKKINIEVWGVDDDDAFQKRKDAKSDKINADRMHIIELQDDLIEYLKRLVLSMRETNVSQIIMPPDILRFKSRNKNQG